MNDRVTALASGVLLLLQVAAAGEAPIVVADHGGASALAYYRSLNLQSRTGEQRSSARTLPAPLTPKSRYSEANMLPVHSPRLTLGEEKPRAVAIPGLNPFFLIGADDTSRDWLLARRDTLRALRAIGFVVEVQTEKDLQALRQLALDLTLVPASADDLAERLGVRHYPVLITATAIEP